jgi:NTP pyrophosphatase (non-canonical NTP hydrolase)
VNLDETQAAVDTWIKTHGGGYWGKFEILARMTEELGEVASALQRSEGLRPRKTEVDLPDEVGDLLFTLAAFANVNGIRLDQAMESTMLKYTRRDAQAWMTSQERKS